METKITEKKQTNTGTLIINHKKKLVYLMSLKTKININNNKKKTGKT